MYWLCGVVQTVSQVPDESREAFAHLRIPDKTPCLLLFHTRHHKFAVLCVEDKSCILQSNQDEFHPGGKAYTYKQYIEGGPPVMDAQESQQFLDDMKRAAVDRDNSAELFRKHFGVAFKPSVPQDYWFTKMPVKPVSELVS